LVKKNYRHLSFVDVAYRFHLNFSIVEYIYMASTLLYFVGYSFEV